MNYPAAELRGIKMNFYLINPDAEHPGILLIKDNNDLVKLPILKKEGYIRVSQLLKSLKNPQWQDIYASYIARNLTGICAGISSHQLLGKSYP